MEMSNSSTESCSKTNNSEINAQTDLKPCCACPDTRKLRDECIFLKGEDNCMEYIEKHKECLLTYGFKV